MKTEIVQHPGKILLAEIEKKGMSQKELAIRTNVSEKHISTIINTTKDISVSFARKLEIALGSEKGYWAELQTKYDLAQITFGEENGIDPQELEILKPLKDIISYFTKKNIMQNNCPNQQKIIQLRSILRVNNLTSIPKITYNAAYRAQLKLSTNIDPYILFAWQRLCEIQTEKNILNCRFNIEKLKNSIDSIKQEMFENDINNSISKLKTIFADCGIAFDVVQHFRGAPVQGFIKQIEDKKVILCLTIRGKKADRFWFSLFHEIGHLVNGDINTRFVDFESVKSDMEAKADIFARDTLIKPDLYKQFIKSGEYFNISSIKQFSKKANIPFWSTIGRRHSDGWLDWSIFANYIPSYSWAED